MKHLALQTIAMYIYTQEPFSVLSTKLEWEDGFSAIACAVTKVCGQTAEEAWR